MFEGMKDMGKLLKQAKEMKGKMQNVQDELKKLTITAEGTQGKIKIVISGELDCKSISIDPELLSNKDALEKALLTTINQAIKKAKDVAASKLSKISGDFSLPGM